MMRGKLFLLLVFSVSMALHSQTYTMQNGVFSTCSGTFFDSGGLTGDYSPNENYQITFCPTNPGSYVQLQFTAFSMEGEPRDFMRIYSGTGTSGPLLGTYGDFSPVGCSNGILSSDPAGCITVTFESDNNNERSGWEAIISCSPTPNTILAPANALCPGAKPFCADAGTLEFPNLSSCDNVPDAPSVVVNNTCLNSAPNPAWYYLSVAIPGRIDLQIEQSTGVGGTGAGLDVDYAIWGPFPDKTTACANFTLGDCTDDHVCTGNVIDCSYSTAPVENATIPSALVGEIYMVLITNYDGRAGFISMTQTNAGNPGAGATDCSIVCPNATGTNPVCGNSNGKITISGLGPSTLYNITYLDDGVPVAVALTSNAAGQVVINGLNAGNYTNILTDFPGCTTSASNVTLASAPPPALTGIIATTPICYGSNAVFTITGTPNAVVTYYINGGSNQTVTLSATGSATVTVNSITVDTTITTPSIALSGCSVTLPYFKTVVVKPLPTITLSSPVADTNQTVCINAAINSISYLMANGATGAIASNLPTGVTGTWNADTFTLSGTPTQGGVFNYTVTTTGGCTPAATLTGTVHVTLLPTASISYAGTPFCKSLAGAQPVTLTGTNAYTGGTFSATPAGLIINAITGAITPSTSAAGTYAIEYLVPASGGCATVLASTTVVVTAVPTASISYAGAPFCSNLTGAQPVTLSGTNAYAGGSFSAVPAGLSINSGTGAVVPSGSLAGTYNVTYQIPASGGCASVSVQSTLKITPNPTANISYAGVPFCKSITTAQPVVLTGTDAYAGGLFSASPAGLSISSTTGAITPSGSSAANYTVTYQVPASAGCASFGVTTSVLITGVPTANISYAGTPFCHTSATAQPVSLTGANAYTGGSFNATPAGLSINSSNGAIIPSGSLPGNYAIVYTFPAYGGCAGNQANTTITITDPPTAAINYSGTPFCKSLTGTQPVTLSGTNAYTGGTFAATPAGLNINALTGVITAASSQPGNYTVSYQIPASGGCATVSATTNVVITGVPTASLIFAGTPFCSTLTTSQSITLTGTYAYTGGTFSATPSGLSINSANGSIVPSASSAGNYNVTYQMPASAGCASAVVQTTLTITSNPTATILYSAAPFCQSITTGQSVTLTGTNAYTGGIYSASPAGLSINPSTGDITPGSSTEANYTVTYQVPATGGCPSFGVTTAVRVTAVPTAAIVYVDAPFCKTLTTSQAVTLTGTNAYAGGAFNATPAGLSINSATGAIIPGSSLPGNYSVVYTFPAFGGCAGNQTNANITITDPPTASINYGGAPFCRSVSTGQAVTLTGTNAYAGGIYSASPAGLSINPSSGNIIPGSSVDANYTVTYQVPASGGCASFGVTTPVRVTAIPTAAIFYVDAPFCKTLTTSQAVTLTGTNAYTGGAFNATPPGLSINSTTGAIVPSTSIADSYSVTYTIPASGGCPSSTTSVPVIIKPTPVVTATPSAVSVCSGETTSISLSSTVINSAYAWTSAQVNVDGAQNGTGNTIAQTLTTLTHGAGTAVYNVIPTADACNGPALSILVRVNPLPVPMLFDGVICINQATNLVARSYTLNAGLGDADYDFNWEFNQNPIVGATQSTYEATQAGVYEVVATNVTTGCVSFPVSAQVTATLAAQAMVTFGYEAFTATPMVVVNVDGIGNYFYQLDNGPQQSSNVFYDVGLGEHTVKVTDPDGCTDLIENITVIGYPKFFTPNEDGYNDSWNIHGFPQNQPGVIYIFDRYGKLIKQLSTSGSGWDGTYNGCPLPSTDYWFTIDYIEKSQQKQFGSHFSLKR